MTEQPMHYDGFMQRWPLTMDKFIDHAARWHPTRELVSRRHDGALHRTTWREVRSTAARLSNALLAHGIQTGDRVGTLAMNSGRHAAAWFGIMGIGAVCHTLNPRFSEDQLRYVVNHGGDRLLIADRQYATAVEKLKQHCPTIERVIFLDDDGPAGWSEFLDGQIDSVRWGNFDENVAAGLCYTSGTTGDPKGVVYTHRSNYLHTMMIIQPDVYAIGANEVLMPIVPMFHANGWGLIFAAAATGCKLVLPGPYLDGASLFDLMEREGATTAAAVPTVWMTLLDHLRATGSRWSTLRRIFVGGAACAENTIRALMEHGIDVRHNWGMTETSPVGTAGLLGPEILRMTADEQLRYRTAQGRLIIGTDLRIVGEDGCELPHDGKSVGAFRVRGHSVVDRYFRAPSSSLDDEGYFDTGDVGTIDEHGVIRITDRSKDVIKSGGEWISSVEIENMATTHPGVRMAAAVGIDHPKWDERPILLVERVEGASVDADEIRDLLKAGLARWALPDAILFVDDIPIGATGKIDKRRLRERYERYYTEQSTPQLTLP